MSSSNQCSNASESDDDIIINGRYELGKKIGFGSFGDIFAGRDNVTGKTVAIKMEPRSSKHNQLAHEFRVYERLQGCDGIPRVFWFGRDGGYNVLVLERKGYNLEQLFNKCHRRFSLKTVLMLTDKLLRRVESLHSNHYVHRDIKPENFLLGLSPHKDNEIYIIDFGLAKHYRDPVTREHVLYKDGKSLTGTARYASINAHMGIELSRRDDVEELALVLLYLQRGSLPWQGIYARSKKEKYARILDEKLNHSITELCREGPKEFGTMLHYARSLRFDEAPDYRYLRRMFRNLFHRLRFLPDEKYDWMILEDQKRLEASGLCNVLPDETEDSTKTY